MSVTFKITDNSSEVLRAFESQAKAGLEAVGNQAVSHAKQIVTEASRVDTGALRNSISHAVMNKVCYIGTNTKYAIFHELGTGIYIAGGRKTPWAYQGTDGEWHWTRGVSPIHMIKNAAANFVNEYKEILRRALRGS
ncbi:MAG: HK97 gp10 family phage protein [Ruminococcus sp.]|nr:HK97 gp10 family phage protein [Ruminococcus sp.]